MVVQLQELDNRIRELQREISALPRHIAQIEKTLESHNRRLEADRAALTANQRERRRLEDDIKAQEEKISKLRGQMTGSKISNEQYQAFKKEIDYCEAEIRKYEDRILDRMSEAEALEQNVKKAEVALAKEKQQVEREANAARQRTSADKTQLEQVQKQRADIVARLTPSVYSSYERIRSTRKGIAIAEAADGRCGVCNMTIRLQLLQDLRKGDTVMFCESCGRILFYNPPVESDGLGPDSPPQIEAQSQTESHPIESR